MRVRVFAGVVVLAVAASAQVNPSLFSGMSWRLVGPFRAGRVSAVAGVPGDPAVYYIGNPGGGVFKTTSGGEVWTPVFDHEPVSSIGAIAVAPSNPNIIYVGTGDVDNVGGSVNDGDGVYKSTDGGRTWQHVGLDDTRHIGAVWVDPHNYDIVLVAALGHTYASNPDRGVFRSTDGGRTWTKVLYEGPSVGAISLAADPDNPQEIFAGLEWHAPTPGGRGRGRRGAGGFARGRGRGPAPPAEPGTGIYKSSDEGATWTPVHGNGLPASSLGRIGLAVAARTNGRRVYAITTAGLFRSDDSGANWHSVASDDRRVMGSSYFSEVYVAPDNPDIVYVMQTTVYRSTDGGAHFIAWKGAPGGDDYHEMWIDPTNAQRMILGVDQGATISLNGGEQWSLGWYNLPNGQFYHIAVDNRTPYWIYGTQQDSGSAAVRSFGDFGETSFMDWRPSVGAYEFGYIHPDLADPNFIYATGGGSELNRYNWTTKQILDITPPPSGNWRYSGSPEAESPQHPETFYLGAQMVLATRDRGRTWQAVSPDLTGGGRAAITALATSEARDGELWAGTSDGRVEMTAGGALNWKLVTPPGLPPQTPIEMIAAAPTDAATAYVVVERHTANDFNPYIFRTRDGGANWARANNGIPDGDFVHVVRADPQKEGLIYAGTEDGAYVSFDHGDHWQPLQLNLPMTSVRDLRVHGDDLIAATYGRAIWILDDVSPLRQLTPGEAASELELFRPQLAVRRQPDVNYDTPFPPEMATGQNPPAGAVVDYYLPRAVSSVTLSVYDTAGKLVRQLTSDAPPAGPEPKLQIPNYWLATPHPLPTSAGMHRVVWDLRYSTPPSFAPQQPIAALDHDTPADPRGPFVTPGAYEIRLSVDGATLRQPLRVGMDPRIQTSTKGLAQQRDLALAIAQALRASYAAAQQADGAARGTLMRANSQLSSLIALVELSDDAPTPAMQEKYTGLCRTVATALAGSPGHEATGMPALSCSQ